MFKLVFKLFLLMCPVLAQAFCGFYVAKADSRLFNKASQVVMVRDGNRTVITMSNDFKGDMRDFAMVIPVPELLKKQQIHVTENALLEHLDHYSAPRLVEYFDQDPCQVARFDTWNKMPMAVSEDSRGAFDHSLGVTIEASYTVGEYDILILSAKQSDGLLKWLRQNDYRIPEGAEPIVNGYIRQGMYFFVAKVNLTEQLKIGFNSLRPIQVAFESPKFMLPIRLGMVNADGAQELYVYMLSRQGRVETINYRTVKLPSDAEIPVFVKKEFGDFYRAMFKQQVKKQDYRAVFLEYAWDMNWCDPCAADPLSDQELRELGVFWVGAKPAADPNPGIRMPLPQGRDIYITRLHLSYDRDHFPEDLFFQQTANRDNFQGRYIIRHPWKGEPTCPEAENYLKRVLPKRQQKEAETLANLTGWDNSLIRGKIPGIEAAPVTSEQPWWEDLWQD